MSAARRLGILVGLGLGLWSPAPAWGETPPPDDAAGLFALRPMLPGKLPFLTPEFAAGSLPSPGESRWRADLFHASTLQFTDGLIHPSRPDPELEDVLTLMDELHDATDMTLYYFDGETSRLDLGYTRGMPGGWELGLIVPLVRHGSGALDPYIDNFHGISGLADSGRKSAPNKAAAMVLLTESGDLRLVGEELPSGEVGDLTVSARFALPAMGERLTGTAAALVELPTGDSGTLAGSGSLDFGGSLLFRWTFARSRLTLGAGYAVLGGLEAVPGLPTSNTVSATVGYEHRLAAWASILGQLLYSSSPYAGLDAGGISGAAGNLAVGPRFFLGRKWVLDAAVVEDLFGHQADLDFGILLSLLWRPSP